jgi:Cu/Ag efflux protein CusF
MPVPLRITLLCVLLTGTIVFANPKPAPTPVVPNRAKGPIEKLDLPANLITLTTKEGPRTFLLTPKTYVFRNKDKITPAQLKVGETIAMSLYPDEQGRLLINRIKAYALPVSTTTNSPPVVPK